MRNFHNNIFEGKEKPCCKLAVSHSLSGQAVHEIKSSCDDILTFSDIWRNGYRHMTQFIELAI